MIRYIRKYIHFYKKSYIPLFLILLSSTFLLSSLYIAKDSYDNYNLNAAIAFNGNYDVKCSLYDYKKNKVDTLSILNYETNEYINSQESITFATNLDVYPIQVIKGKRPKKNQILLHSKYTKKYKIGQSYHGYKISGFYKNLNTELVNSTAYVHTNSKKDAMTIYANVNNKETLNLLGDLYTINENVVQYKYHLNTSFEYAFIIFYILVTLYCFVLNYNGFNLHYKKQQPTFKQLHTLAFSKKQLVKWILIEYTSIYLFSFLFSFILSIGLWNLLLHLPFDTLIPLSFSITPVHVLLLTISMFAIYGLSLFLILRKEKRSQFQKYRFKKYRLNCIPIKRRIILLDSIRTQYSIILVFLFTISLSFIFISNSMIQSWSKQVNTNIEYKHAITATYNIFNHEKISNFISECNQILKGTKHSFNYTINCQAYIGQEEIETRTTNKKEYILTNTSSNYVMLKLLKVGQETIDTIYINDVKNVSTSSNKTILYIPENKMEEWLDTYPQSYLTGDLWTNTSTVASQLNSISLSSTDEFYVMNYEQDAKTIKNSLMMIRIFIYGFYIIMILTCIFVSYSQIYQYILSRKKEIELLHILGISKKDLIYLYIQHLIFLLFLSILFSSILKGLI